MELKEKIKKAGINNCMFIVPMLPLRNMIGINYTSSSDDKVDVPCIINEDRYKIEDNYKITLVSIYEGFGKQNFYISDLEGSIESGKIIFYIKA